MLEHVGRSATPHPLDVHDRARRRGWTSSPSPITTRSRGASRLAHLPDTFVSEEVTVLLDGGRQLHVNVFGLAERQHEALQARRRDFEAFLAFLAEERLPASCSTTSSPRSPARGSSPTWACPWDRFPLIEALSGAMPEGHNERARIVGREAGMAPVGGSDAHSLAHVARAFTTVPGAQRRGVPRGPQDRADRPLRPLGGYARLTGEVVRIFAAGYAQTLRKALAGTPCALRVAASLLLAPFLPLIPLFTLGVHAHERRFGARHFRAFQEAFGWPDLPSERPSAIGAASLGEAA